MNVRVWILSKSCDTNFLDQSEMGIYKYIIYCRIFSNTLLEKHKKSLTELIRRDKNRPSVIMWSVANEPRTQYEISAEYFRYDRENCLLVWMSPIFHWLKIFFLFFI